MTITRPCKWMLCIATVVVLTSFSRLATATTIVQITTARDVVIATDSAGTFRGNGGPTYVQPVCKLYERGRFVFAVGGMVNDPVTGFDLTNAVAEALSDKLNISEALSEVDNHLLPKIANERAKGMEARDPEGDEPGAEPRAVTVMIVTTENGNPVSGDTRILISRSEGVKLPPIEHRLCNQNHCDEPIIWSAPTKTVIPLHRSEIVTMFGRIPDADLAQKMVEFDIEAGTNGVKGPIDVVKLDATGVATYVQMKPHCPIILTPPHS